MLQGLALPSQPRGAKDVYAWTNNWAELCNCRAVPVLTDSQARSMIRAKPDYEAKLQKVIADLTPPVRRTIFGFSC